MYWQLRELWHDLLEEGVEVTGTVATTALFITVSTGLKLGLITDPGERPSPRAKRTPAQEG